MKRIPTVPQLRLVNGIVLAVALFEVCALGQVTPYYGFTNLAGLGGSSGAADGANTAARFNGPYGIEIDAQHNAYVADCWNHGIRKITSEGVVTTWAGVLGTAGSSDGTNSGARFNGPMSSAVDSTGNVFVSDTFNSTIRKITPAGGVTTLAGASGAMGSADGTNASARFYMQRGIAVDTAGYVYVADYYNCLIRKVSPAGVVTTLAGAAGNHGSTDGSTNVARFYYPAGITVDTNGNVFVADCGNNTIRKITPAGIVSTVAGLAGASGYTDGTNSQARFSGPNDVAVDNAGNLFVADGAYVVRKIAPDGVVTTIGGLAGSTGSADGTNSQARFGQIGGIAVDEAGNLYLADWTAHRLIKGTPIYPPPPVITSTSPLPSGTVGSSYTTSLMATGGVAPYAWTILSGGLPSGLGMNTTGAISGNPTATANTNFTVKATGANTAYSTQTFTITIYAPLSITTASTLPAAASGAYYSQTLAATGGQPPYLWATPDGSLPAGLGLSADGVISGTPTATGSRSFEIMVRAANGDVTTGVFTLTVNQGVPFSENFDAAASIPAGWTQEYVVDTVSWVFQKGGHNNANPANPHSQPYNALLWSSSTADHKTKLVTPMLDFGTNTAAQLTFWVDTKVYYLYQDTVAVYYKTNATAPWIYLGNRQYTSWSQVTMDLPTPTRTYYIGFEGNARGGYGVLLDDVSIVAVAPPAAPVLLGGNKLPTGTVGTPYNQTLSASGGTTPYSWGLASGTLPEGLGLSSGGVLSGTPTTAGSSTIGIRVAGADGMASTNVLSLAINQAPTATEPLYSFTSWVGQAGSYGSTDGTNSQARFSAPVGVGLDLAGNLYVGDSWNHTIRKITPGGTVTTLAGLAGASGTNDGVGSTARFYNPAGVSADSNGVVYVADENNNTIRAVTENGTVTTLAGTPGRSGIDPEDPNWYCFWEPTGVAASDDGVYVADTVNNTISHVWKADGEITILAGYNEGSADGTGLNAQFRWPQGLAVSQGTFYVADTGNGTIRKITAAGVTTTLAGSPGVFGSADGTNNAARFMTPYAVAVDGNGNLFVADRDNHNIRKISPAGVVTTIGGLAGTSGSTEDVGLGARFKSPQGIAVDKDGVLYIADTGNNRIVKGTPVLPAGGILQWTSSSAQASETNSGVTLYVARTGSTTGSVSCNYATADGSATAGSDYVATNGVLTWLDGDGAAKAIFVPIVNDGQPEGSEEFTVTLTGTSVGALATTTVTLGDDDTPTRIIRIVGDLAFGAVTVGQSSNRTYTIYNDGNSPLTPSAYLHPYGFAMGDATGTLDPIAPGGSKTVSVKFTPPVAINCSGNVKVECDSTSGTKTIPISGTGVNPPAGVIQTGVPNYIIPEDGIQAMVRVSRVGGSYGTISCNYTTEDNTAKAGMDYTATSGTLTWTNGDTENKYITVPLLEDVEVEGQEDFRVRLSGGPIGDPASTLVIIQDNDIGVAPAITSQPVGLTVNVGAAAALNVTATGTAPLGYQWCKNGTNLMAPNQATLSLTPAQTNQAGNYTVVVTNLYGSTTSSVAALVVNRLAQTLTFGALPEKQIGAAPFTLSASSSAGLTVSYTSSVPGVATVSGNTVTIVGAGDTLITASQAGDANYLPATNVAQNLHVTGNGSTVLVQDHFTNPNGTPPDATKFDFGGTIWQDGNSSVYLGASAGTTTWLRSKATATPAAGQTLIVQIRSYAYAEGTSPGIVYGDKQPRGLRVGSDANNCLEFYSATRTSVGLRARKAGAETLLTYALPAGVDSMHLYEISVTTTAAVFKVDGTLAGTITSNIPTGALGVYADSYYNGGGNVPAYVDSVLLTLTDGAVAGTAPGISGQPVSLTVNVTSNAAFTVTAIGTTPLAYQWRQNAGNLVAETNATLTLNNVQTNQAGNYSVVITNAWGSITSSVATLTVNRLAQSITFGALSEKRPGDAPFVLNASASSGLPVAYTSSALTVATVSGNVVTIVGIGDTTITAQQDGDATYLPATNVAQNLHVAVATNLATVLVEDTFSGSSEATPDPTKWEWSGQANLSGSGQLSLSTTTTSLSWIKSKAGAAVSAGQTLVAQIRAYAYAEGTSPGTVYGDKQPRGLRVGTDANNAIEFYSANRVSVGMRCRKAGVETIATYSLPAGVDSQHDYQISVTTTAVVFKVDGTTAGTITANIPTGPLNLYIDSNDGGAGNVPVSVDNATLTLNALVTPPQITAGGTGFGVQTNRFGFTITGTSGSTVVVEASTNLTSGWAPIWTNTLNSGAAYFSDPTWTNYRVRFYRVR